MPHMHARTSEEIKPVREYIQDWPYVSEYLQATLDPERIADHGRAILRRALNNGELVAFLGSGVSMAYGRLGWGEMVNAFSADRPPDATGPMAAVIRRWLDDLDIRGRGRDDSPHSGRYPAIFQFLENLHKLAAGSNAGVTAEDSRLRRMMRKMLFDDTGKAIRLLEEARKLGGGMFASLTVPELPDAALSREEVNQPQASDANWRQAFVLLPDDVPCTGDPPASRMRFLQQLRALSSDAHRANPATMFPPPAMRFVSLALALLHGEHEQRMLTRTTQHDQRVGGPLRADALPPEQDPLLLLAGALSIDRFITTNYDLDTERLLRDRGFTLHLRRPSPGAEPGLASSSDALGQQASDGLFKAERAAELVDFALHSSDDRVSLLHLHGRATSGDPMVVTDADYLHAYFQRGDDAELAEHGLALAVGANPLLFVGCGMSEDDVLRPLRQFVAERRSSGDRQAVVLLPADSTRARQIEDAITLYSRFGVYTQHYGTGREGTEPVRWLAAFQRVANCVKALLEPPESAGAKSSAEMLRRAITQSVLEPYLAPQYEGESERGQQARPFALWGTSADRPGRLELHMPELVEGTLTRPSAQAASALVMACLNLLVAQAIDLARPAKLLPQLLKAWHVPPKLREAVLAAPSSPDPEALQACRLIAGELPNALTGLALCLKLRAIEQDLREWRDQRSVGPLYRPALGPILRLRGGPAGPPPDGLPSVYLRHPLALGPLPGSQPPAGGEDGDNLYGGPSSDRFFSDAPSQTFGAWLSSMRGRTALCGQCTADGERTVPRHRRVFVLYAERGAGKGHFFEALHTTRRLNEFVRDSWPGYQPPVPYAAFAYFNISFSLEVVSAFDRLSRMLADQAHAVLGKTFGVMAAEALVSLRHNRVALLSELLQLYAKAPAPNGRVLIAISPFNMMFDERGVPKNAELFRIIVALLGQAAAAAPIDLMLICSGDPLPSLFCRPVRLPMRLRKLDGWAWRLPTFELQHLKPGTLSAKRQRQLDDTLRKLRVRVVPDGAPGLGDAWFHVMREARTANTIAKYFPEIALALARHAGALNRSQGAQVQNLADPWFASQEAASALSEVIHKRSQTFDTAEPLIKGIARALGSRHIEKALDTATQEQPLRAEALNKCFDQALTDVVGGLDASASLSALDSDCGIIFRAFEHSRFLVTLACAASAELAWADPLATHAQPLRARAIIDWWRDLLGRLEASQANDKPDVVVLHVLAHYQARHDLRSRLPVEFPSVPAAVGDLLRGPPGWELQQRLLWHLAVIGHPVEGDVLALAPAVRHLLQGVLQERKDSDPSFEDVKLAVTHHMLDVLVRRCLVFRIEPTRLKGERAEAKPNWRFTLHRFLQRAIFRQLHAPYVEHAIVDQFGLSMWATQPDDLPRPSRQSAEQIATLLAQWTGFPKDPETIMRASTYHRALHETVAADSSDRRARSLPARLLRASFGVVRTVYSVGVVSRFHDFAGTSELRAPTEGFFEQHRLQVRWIIEKARELRYLHSEPGADMAATEGTESNAPFFPEEIVWLYNECGLFSLVEGRLDSAAGLFGLALRRARDIEGNDANGALWCRIHLNLAVTDIERGRIREARKNLQAIRAVDDENPILRLLATGYLALVDHYSGNSSAAEAVFKDVIEDLEAYGQSRSVAIFARHLAELYRLRGLDAAEQARQAIDRSIAAATKGGHEDLRQLARLSRVRLAIDGHLSDEAHAIQRRLDEIETYGIDMGMPRLVADTAYAKATHLLKLGETRHAMQLARECLLVAKTHNLRLRQMTALALMGRVCERRGMSRASRHLLGRAFELAESCDYSNARANVRRMQR